MPLPYRHSKQQFISVVIPVYNEENFIKACLDSLAKQTHLPDAVYIVDNNSTDNSIEIARSYSFVSIIHEPIQGICAATKKGLDEAAKNGGIILRLDADCRPYSDWVQRMMTILNNDASAVAVTGPGIVYDTNPFMQTLITLFYMQPYFLLVGLALGRKPLFGSNFAIQASTWLQINNKTHLSSHQNIHDDIDISYHLETMGKIIYDHTLHMPISARPFKASFLILLKRYSAGFRSIFIHWPEQAPWKNWRK
jgi:glycosyltransferase involved in cell wall biosynthesis